VLYCCHRVWTNVCCTATTGWQPIGCCNQATGVNRNCGLIHAPGGQPTACCTAATGCQPNGCCTAATGCQPNVCRTSDTCNRLLTRLLHLTKMSHSNAWSGTACIQY
jgi:hypothetical protein